MTERMREALRFCMKREFEAMELYEAALKHVEDEGARSTLAFLAAEERRHLDEISKGLARAKLGERGVRRLVERFREEGRRRAEERLKAILARGALDARTILEAALEEEKKSESVYKLNARTMPDIEVRAFYLTLMQEEKEHVKTIKAALSLVQKGIVDPRSLRPRESRGKLERSRTRRS